MTKNEKLERLKEELLAISEIDLAEFEAEDYLRAEQILIDTIMTLTTSNNYEMAKEICDIWYYVPKPLDD